MRGREFLLDNKAVSRPECKARHRASPAIQAIGLTRLPACAAVGSQERARPTACGCGCGCGCGCCLESTIAGLLRGPTSLLEDLSSACNCKSSIRFPTFRHAMACQCNHSLAAWALAARSTFVPCSRYVGKPPQRDVATPELMWRTAVNNLPIPPARPAL
jgi:hypothetical protein